MVQRLKALSVTGVLVGTTLAGCASFTSNSGLPLTASDFCPLMRPRYPILISRQDHPQTKRQAVELNRLIETKCIGEGK